MRKITVYSSAGRKVVINSEAVNYGLLKPQLEENGFEINDSTEVIERVSKNAFTIDEAILPEGDFTLYINQSKKIKSGADLTREELFDFIRNNPEYKSHFKKGSLNHTQISTDELNEMYNTLQENLAILGGSKKTTAKVTKVVEKSETTCKNCSNDFLSKVLEDLRNAYSSEDWDDVNIIITDIEEYLENSGDINPEDAEARKEMNQLFKR